MHNFINKEILNWGAFYKVKVAQSKDERLKSFYRTGMYHDETKLSDIDFVALDFETTGLDSQQNSIISIGLVPFNLKRIFCRQAQHWYIDPEDKLQENSIIIHGITHTDLKGAPDLLRILEPVLEALAGKVVVVHYRRIERDFFDSNLRSLINEGIVFPVVDTMQIEADVQDAQAKGFFSLFKRKRQDSIRLANSRSRYHLPVYPPHDALTDAIATAELLQAQIHYHFSPDTPIKNLWL
ncbi:3'-5' exonuclease [Moritella viscosa]|uniref:DNA polymerase III subunit epsilon n=1 Tax=Moritella viscosa TaxID=80854 RepID=A0A090IHY5_9GAMM|nr:3'-5' exonuclease [Moritella viscosa]CED59634.1 putative exonuclease [Moritella viscosa]SGY89132.1 DNA polymerase III subunit epsilon [Moritella viscosa]SGY89133.1 DNA polymerase III subunit epsilon [Moritella viscosa]SGY91267.1 DNA polymerase III subunit epsilon [Moritella viscosa]SGY91712.1 DNA polymerase III subunit epsilon [Moritella viscosa]